MCMWGKNRQSKSAPGLIDQRTVRERRNRFETGEYIGGLDFGD